MSSYKREIPSSFEIEANDKGLVRVVFPESRMIDEAGALVTTGPWCIDELNARRWWTSSETARQMREGTKMGLGAT